MLSPPKERDLRKVNRDLPLRGSILDPNQASLKSQGEVAARGLLHDEQLKTKGINVNSIFQWFSLERLNS